jgi:hypothetical protein
VAFKFSVGSSSYQGFPAYVRLVFSKVGIIVGIYFLIGVFYNTAPPHFPGLKFTAGALHSWTQYIISIMLWPLSFWHPLFSISRWSRP